MAHVKVFIDESGDFGFKKTSSTFFVVSYVIPKNSHFSQIEQETKRFLQKINVGKKAKDRISEFKFSNDEEKTRKLFLQKINSFDLTVGIAVLNKGNVRPTLKRQKRRLYQYFLSYYPLKTVINDHLKVSDRNNTIHLILDRVMSKQKRKQFNKYCQEIVQYLAMQRSSKLVVNLRISHKSSQKAPLLQIADYFASSAFLKCERKTDIYLNMVRRQIKQQDEWNVNDNFL